MLPTIATGLSEPSSVAQTPASHLPKTQRKPFNMRSKAHCTCHRHTAGFFGVRPVTTRVSRQLQNTISSATGKPASPGTTKALPSTPLRSLHPAGKAIETGNLKVSDIHTIHYQVYGNPQGQPVLVVHGGPGAGCYANHARFFDLEHWRVVLVDQRGCGSSTPLGCLVDNNTPALIDDYEKLRKKLKIRKWTLFGGSWGVALSLAYAQQHANKVAAIVLRGVCLMRQAEVQWMFGGGAGHLQPLGWRNFEGHIPPAERGDIVAAYHQRLTSPDSAVRDAAGKAWLGWEHSVSSSRTGSLQVWGGQQWSQTDFPHTPTTWSPLPLAVTSSPQNGGSHGAPAEGAPATQATRQAADGSARQEGGGGARQEGGGGATQPAQPASMSAFMAQALLECHYSHNNAFLQDPLLQGIDAIRHIPCIAIQGRLDYVCPVVTAYDLHCEWPEMELRVVPNAGHSMYDAGITHELLEATDRLRLRNTSPPTRVAAKQSKTQGSISPNRYASV